MAPQHLDEEQAPPRGRSRDDDEEEGESSTLDEHNEREQEQNVQNSSSSPQQEDPEIELRILQEDDGDDRTVMTVDSDAPTDARPPLAVHHQSKQGGKFCGYFCDYRRAVIIIGTVTVIMGLLDLVFRIGNADPYQPPFDDDSLSDELIELNDMYRIPFMLLEAMAVVFGSVSIMSALNFSQVGVSLTRYYYVFSKNDSSAGGLTYLNAIARRRQR